MAEELPTVPPIVKRLAEEVHMTPVAWLVADDHVTICFQEGPKLRFDRGDVIIAEPKAIIIGTPKPPPSANPASRSKPDVAVSASRRLPRRKPKK